MASASSLGPLSVGNVVSAAFSLYKSQFKTFLKLAGWGVLWSLVPVYGWAKSAMYQGLIARLAFGQLSNQPETVDEARTAVADQMWNFLVVQILVGLIMGGTYFAVIVLAMIVLIPVGIGLNAGLGDAGLVITGILAVLAVLALILVLTWLYGRLLIPEVPLAVEAELRDPTAAVGRSWTLTKTSALRVMAVTFVAGLVVVPVNTAAQAVPRIMMAVTPDDSPVVFLWLLVLMVLAMVASVAVIPFWQSIKAAVYYDLRARREGLDIQLRDRPI